MMVRGRSEGFASSSRAAHHRREHDAVGARRQNGARSSSRGVRLRAGASSGRAQRAAAGPSTSDGTPSVASSDVLFRRSDVQFTMTAAKESRWAARSASTARRRYSCPTTARQARQRSTPRSDRPRRAGDHSRPSSGPRFTDPTHRSPVPDALFSRTEQANGARG
jgi:hypothetical protein